MIYLDNAATTYPKPESVYKALDYANRNQAFNAGRGSYTESKEAFELVQETRLIISKIANKEGCEVVFTATATDAINDIINGLNLSEGDNVYITPFEHNAVARCLELIKEKRHINVFLIEFDKETWALDKESLANSFAVNKPKLVVSTHISNVTGYILPYEEIFSLAKQYDAYTLLDSAQSFGILKINNKYVDFEIFDGHKSLYSSFGVGGFVNINNTELTIYKAGGTGSDSLNLAMPNNVERYEPGTHNVVAISGVKAGINWLNSMPVKEKIEHLSTLLLKELQDINGIRVFTPVDDKLFGIVSFIVEGYASDEVGKILYDEYGICVRTGFHCAPYVHNFIGSLSNKGTVRISVGFFNTEDDILRLCEALKTL